MNSKLHFFGYLVKSDKLLFRQKKVKEVFSKTKEVCRPPDILLSTELSGTFAQLRGKTIFISFDGSSFKSRHFFFSTNQSALDIVVKGATSRYFTSFFCAIQNYRASGGNHKI